MVRCQQCNILEYHWFIAFLNLKVFLMELNSFFGKTETTDLLLDWLIDFISIANNKCCEKGWHQLRSYIKRILVCSWLQKNYKMSFKVIHICLKKQSLPQDVLNFICRYRPDGHFSTKSWIKCSLRCISCDIKFLVRLDTSVSKLSILSKPSFSASLKIFLILDNI